MVKSPLTCECSKLSSRELGTIVSHQDIGDTIPSKKTLRTLQTALLLVDCRRSTSRNPLK